MLGVILGEKNDRDILIRDTDFFFKKGLRRDFFAEKNDWAATDFTKLMGPRFHSPHPVRTRIKIGSKIPMRCLSCFVTTTIWGTQIDSSQKILSSQFPVLALPVSCMESK